MSIFNFFKNRKNNNQIDIQVSVKNTSAPAEKQITTENNSNSLEKPTVSNDLQINEIDNNSNLIESSSTLEDNLSNNENTENTGCAENKGTQIDCENSYPVYAEYNAEIEEAINRIENDSLDNNQNDYDSKLDEAIQVVIEEGIASTSLIQRRLKVPYTRAGRIIDEMEQLGIVGPHKGAVPRDVLITYNEWLDKRSELKNKIASNNIKRPKKVHITHQNQNNPAQRQTLRQTFCEIINKKLGFKPDYTNDGFFVEKFDNYIFPQFSGEPSTLINGIIKYSSPNTVQLLLCDFGTYYEQFHGIPSTVLPIMNEPKRAVAAITWLKDEMRQRYKIFSEFGCRDIHSYNELIDRNLEYIKNNPPIKDKTGELVQPVLTVNGLPVAKEKMSYLVCSVSEFYNLSSYNELDEALVNLLLNSKKAGIYLFFFSRLSIKNLNLGIKTDLLKVGNQNDIDYFFEKTGEFTNNKSIDDIDNNMNGYDFEQFCGDLLKSNGFRNINVTKSSGDYGADLTAIKDGVKYAIQCKKFSNPVGVSAIQEVIASKSMYNCHVAVVLTNNYFTNNAISLAEKNNVLLWDRNKLIAMMNTKKNAESN